MSSASAQKLRRYILTASFTAITATGAWYGAGLKMRQEYTQEKQAIQQVTTAEKIEQLEKTKAKLVDQRTEMQEKIDRLTAKMKSDSQKARQQAG